MNQRDHKLVICEVDDQFRDLRPRLLSEPLAAYQEMNGRRFLTNGE